MYLKGELEYTSIWSNMCHNVELVEKDYRVTKVF